MSLRDPLVSMAYQRIRGANGDANILGWPFLTASQPVACLDQHWFIAVDDAWQAIAARRIVYNVVRPPALENRAPAAYKAGCLSNQAIDCSVPQMLTLSRIWCG